MPENQRCDRCGAKIQDDMSYCPICGLKIERKIDLGSEPIIDSSSRGIQKAGHSSRFVFVTVGGLGAIVLMLLLIIVFILNGTFYRSIGSKYINSVPQTDINLKEAFKWYMKAAERGDALAENYIGNMYKRGLGVSQDYEKAVYWYQKSADQGNASAQNNLGYMYSLGLGVVQDYEKAVYWYQKSADQGNEAAQYNLSVLKDNNDDTTAEMVSETRIQ